MFATFQAVPFSVMSGCSETLAKAEGFWLQALKEVDISSWSYSQSIVIFQNEKWPDNLLGMPSNITSGHLFPSAK